MTNKQLAGSRICWSSGWFCAYHEEPASACWGERIKINYQLRHHDSKGHRHRRNVCLCWSEFWRTALISRVWGFPFLENLLSFDTFYNATKRESFDWLMIEAKIKHRQWWNRENLLLWKNHTSQILEWCLRYQHHRHHPYHQDHHQAFSPLSPSSCPPPSDFASPLLPRRRCLISLDFYHNSSPQKSQIYAAQKYFYFF